MAKQNTSQKVFIGILAVMTAVTLAGAGGIFGGGVSPNNGVPAQQSADNISTSNIPCLTSGVFHLHPRLVILLDGEEVPLPANVGVESNCVRELHTHESDGVIHVESDVDKGYTLADFLGLLGLPLDQQGYITKLTVNGNFDNNNPNFKLEDGQEIVLEYITIPSDFGAVETGSQETVPEAE